MLCIFLSLSKLAYSCHRYIDVIFFHVMFLLAFLTGSNAIFWPENTRLMSLLVSILLTAVRVM